VRAPGFTSQDFQGGLTNGTCGYVIPNNNSSGWHSKIARFGLQDFYTIALLDLPDLTTRDTALMGFPDDITVKVITT